MGESTIFRKFRDWLALDVVLQVFYFIFGQKPLFCDFAEELGCELENDLNRKLGDQSREYHNTMRAMITASGGTIRISPIILHDAGLYGTIESTIEIDGTYVYTAKL